MSQINIETEFQETLLKRYSTHEKHFIPKDIYYKTIDDLKTASKTTATKSRHKYYIVKKYEALQCGDVEKLTEKRWSTTEQPLYYVTIEDTYDIIKKTHISTGHGGRDRMLKYLGAK